MLSASPKMKTEDHILMRQLEAALAESLEWRQIAKKLKKDNNHWASECERLQTEAGRPSQTTAAKDDDRFHKIKAVLTKGLHPDGTKDVREKKYRTALFQELWPQIVAIEKSS